MRILGSGGAGRGPLGWREGKGGRCTLSMVVVHDGVRQGGGNIAEWRAAAACLRLAHRSLLDYVREKKKLPEAEAALILQQLIHALQFCHRKVGAGWVCGQGAVVRVLWPCSSATQQGGEGGWRAAQAGRQWRWGGRWCCVALWQFEGELLASGAWQPPGWGFLPQPHPCMPCTRTPSASPPDFRC